MQSRKEDSEKKRLLGDAAMMQRLSLFLPHHTRPTAAAAYDGARRHIQTKKGQATVGQTEGQESKRHGRVRLCVYAFVRKRMKKNGRFEAAVPLARRHDSTSRASRPAGSSISAAIKAVAISIDADYRRCKGGSGGERDVELGLVLFLWWWVGEGVG
jgi:hypothetical protein